MFYSFPNSHKILKWNVFRHLKITCTKNVGQIIFVLKTNSFTILLITIVSIHFCWNSKTYVSYWNILVSWSSCNIQTYVLFSHIEITIRYNIYHSKIFTKKHTPKKYLQTSKSQSKTIFRFSNFQISYIIKMFINFLNKYKRISFDTLVHKKVSDPIRTLKSYQIS